MTVDETLAKSLGKEVIALTSRPEINLRLLEFYIKSGARLDTVIEGKTALYNSVGNIDACRMIVAAMKEQGIPLNLEGADNPLIPALENVEVLKLLLDAGVDSNKYKDNPLVPAIENENRAAFDLLIRAKADPNIYSGEPPLFVAMRTKKEGEEDRDGYRRWVDIDLSYYRKALLENGAKTTALTKKGVPLICDDSGYGRYLKEFLPHTTNEDLAAALKINGYPLQRALWSKDFTLAERFLKLGVATDYLSKGFETCIDKLSEENTEGEEKGEYLRLARLLLEHGADPRKAEEMLRKLRHRYVEDENISTLYESILEKLPQAGHRLSIFFERFQYGVEEKDEATARTIMQGVDLAGIGPELSKGLAHFVKEEIVDTYAHDDERALALKILLDHGLAKNAEYKPDRLLAASLDKDQKEITKLLLENGAPVTEKMIDGFIEGSRKI